jgi:hypothetical protein
MIIHSEQLTHNINFMNDIKVFRTSIHNLQIKRRYLNQHGNINHFTFDKLHIIHTKKWCHSFLLILVFDPSYEIADTPIYQLQNCSGYVLQD